VANVAHSVVILGACADILIAQNTNQDSLSRQIQKLTDAIASTQAQLEQSQRQIVEMQKQLKALQQQMAARFIERRPFQRLSWFYVIFYNVSL
jgi:septal ring factor EnvC (AmiA/AmiB activator)